MRVVTVFRSGGDYQPKHVNRLQDQLRKVSDVEMVCLSDQKIEGIKTVPLFRNLPGWWAKMNMFHPAIRGKFLYVDLDTSFIGDLSEVLSVKNTTIMRDVYRPTGLQSSIMMLKEEDRPLVWASWIRKENEWMNRFKKGGDQQFLETVLKDKVDIWQDILPGQIVSFKADCNKGKSVPDSARVVVFHGKPRPWEAGW